MKRTRSTFRGEQILLSATDGYNQAMAKGASQLITIRYLLAVCAVALAIGATRLLRGLGDSGITPLFFAAVLVSSWYGGLGPGLLSTVLSGIGTAYLLATPRGLIFVAIGEHVLRLVVFTGVALLTNSMHGAIRRAAEASEQARRAAESASAAKTRFLAMVSHELRTPLSPVLMIADLWSQDPRLPEFLKKDVQTIRRNVDLEIRLIEDLVDLTRITAGKMSLRQEVVDLHQPILAALGVCESDVRDKGLKLSVQLTQEQATIWGDAVRLQQIFWNLLRNAIKFTPAGGSLSVVTRRLVGGDLQVDISDTGIGIAPEDLTRIFEAFDQGSPRTAAEFGGLGLGLAICRALVLAHGGSIEAQSPGPGRGATFTVTFAPAPAGLPVVPPRVRGEDVRLCETWA